MKLTVQAGKIVAAGVLCSLASLTVGPIVGCQKIVGIEDSYVPSGGGGGGGSPACQMYCGLVKDTCTETRMDEDNRGPFKLFLNDAECSAYCGAVEKLTAPSRTAKAPLQCRLDAVKDPESPTNSCNNASPTGGNTCDADACSSFCAVYIDTCCTAPAGNPNSLACTSLGSGGAGDAGMPMEDAQAGCERKCEAMRRDEPYIRTAEDGEIGSYSNDSLQCRFVHLVAAIVGDKIHCGHASFNSNLHCFDPATSMRHPANCDDYCRVTQGACPSDAAYAVYEDDAQCMAACQAFDDAKLLGANRDYTEDDDDQHPNTIGCRRDHANYAFEIPNTHCTHAGPLPPPSSCGGDMSSECESFCVLRTAAAGCDPGMDMAACIAQCETFPAGNAAGYLLANATEDNLDCRARWALRSLTATGAAKTTACNVVQNVTRVCPSE